MATILAHIKVRAGREDDFETLARDLYAATHAAESDVLSYQYWRGAEPRSYYTLLAFADHRAFVVHQSSEHHDAVGAGLREVIEDMTLEWVDPIEGASPLPPTNHQHAAPEADDAVVSVTAAYAAVVADWWLAHR